MSVSYCLSGCGTPHLLRYATLLKADFAYCAHSLGLLFCLRVFRPLFRRDRERIESTLSMALIHLGGGASRGVVDGDFEGRGGPRKADNIAWERTGVYPSCAAFSLYRSSWATAPADDLHILATNLGWIVCWYNYTDCWHITPLAFCGVV